MTAQLLLGDLDLMDPDGPYGLAALGTDSGTTFGSPEAIVTRLRSFLQYGSIAVHEGVENRMPVVAVTVTGADMAAVAASEAALMAQLYRANTLTYTTSDGWGAPTVFDVYTSELVPNDNDLLEALRTEVVYTIRFECAPYVHSSTETVTPALAASGTTTLLVDDCESLTGWTGSPNAPTIFTAGSIVGVLGQLTTGPWVPGTVTVTRTGSIDTSVTSYLEIEWLAGTYNGVSEFRVYADGVLLDRISNVPSVNPGFYKSTYEVGASAVTALRFESDFLGGGTGPGIIYIVNINRTDVVPSIGTARQQLRTIAVGGSAPTQGSLAIEHETSALGDVIAYTFTEDGRGFVPALRPSFTSGGTTTGDTSLVSGARNMLDTQVVYDVPVATIYSGTHLLKARLRGNSGGAVTLTVTARMRINSTDVGPVITLTVPLTVTTGWANYSLGLLMLPTLDVATATEGRVRLTIVDADLSGIDVDIDEAWLFNLEIGALTEVACGTGSPTAGGASNRLWIDSPSLSNDGLGRYLRGYDADRLDAYSAYPSMTTPGVHEFKPPSITVFTATSNALEPAVSLAYRAGWHSRAAS